jgi:aldehyde:ferredoxin oxidoreductase
MGSKRLKAVVVSGTSALEVHDAQKVRELRKAFIQRQGKEYKRFQKWGTLGLLQWSAETGDSPVKNWRGSGWDDFGEGIDAFEREKLFKYKTGRYGCWRCNLACGGHMEVKEGEARSTWTHLVEYESACSLGTACLISDFVSIIKATEIVNRAGLDSISAGCAVAFAMDCYEAGILSKEDLGGLGLSWGNAEAMLALVEQMAAGEGLGGLLSMGVKRAAERIGRGAEHYAIHVGGQEVPMHDPRFTPGLATSYQMDATPARHTQGAELLQPVEWDEKFPADKHQYGGKGIVTARASSLLHVVQAAGLCLFGHLSYPVDYLPAFLTAITGWDFSLEECYRAGERIAQLRHAFNLREGINPIMHHQLPGIVYGNPPLEAGELKGITLDVKAQRDDYCEAMGWDKRTAQPGAQRLRDLNLGFLIPDIAQPAGQ